MVTRPVIDLHMHTSVSDGTDTPSDLLSRVREAKIDVFSVTDHDATAGCEQIGSLLRSGDPRFLFGVEFSCKDEHGKYHILGYGYDPNAEAIRSIVKTGHANRMKKLGLRLQLLRDVYGIRFPDADIDALYACNNPGKPHLANLMVRYGYAGSVREAFMSVLNRLHVSDAYIRPEDAIKAVLASGGIAVLAHPCYGDGDQLILGEELENRVERLCAFGLEGLECFYSGFTDALQGETLALADAHGLYVTAGSDYHGTNKLIALADTGLPEGKRFPKGLERFLSDAFSRGMKPVDSSFDHKELLK